MIWYACCQPSSGYLRCHTISQLFYWLTILLFSPYDRLSCADIVLTTYNLVQREVQLPESLKKNKHEQEKAACEDEVLLQSCTTLFGLCILNHIVTTRSLLIWDWDLTLPFWNACISLKHQYPISMSADMEYNSKKNYWSYSLLEFSYIHHM